MNGTPENVVIRLSGKLSFVMHTLMKEVHDTRPWLAAAVRRRAQYFAFEFHMHARRARKLSDANSTAPMGIVLKDIVWLSTVIEDHAVEAPNDERNPALEEVRLIMFEAMLLRAETNVLEKLREEARKEL